MRAGSDGVAATWNERRAWMTQELFPGGAVHYLLAAWRYRGPVDVGRLREALESVVSRHESLRAGFRFVDDQIRRFVQEQVAVEVPVVLLAAEPDWESHLGRDEPFTLDRAPLWRARVLCLPNGDALLAVVVHRAVADRRSLAIIGEDLRTFYFGAKPALPEPPRPKPEADGPGPAAQARAGRFQGVAPVLELPRDRPRPPNPSHQRAVHPVAVSAHAKRRLAALAVEEGAPAEAVWVALYAFVLQLYTQRADVVLGVVDDGRRDVPEPVVGSLELLRPLRFDLTEGLTFRLLLREAGVELAAAEQAGPIIDVLHARAPHADAHRHPVVQMGFRVDRLPAEQWPDLEGEHRSELDLELELSNAARGDVVRLISSADAVDAVTAASFAAALAHLCEEVAANPDRPLKTLPLISADTAEVLLAQGTGRSTDRDLRTVTQRVEERARLQPGAAAIRYGGTVVSYRELDQRANLLAHRLVALGVRPGTRVAVMGSRHPRVLVGYLATLKAGAAYIPFDADIPTARHAAILEDAEPQVLLTDRPGPPGGSWVVLDLAAADESGRAEPPDQGRATGPANAAYVCYTSGSTGRPKGVVVSHGALSNFVEWHVGAFDVTSADIATWLTGIGFDVSVGDIWPNLAVGATVAVPEDELVRLEPELLVAWLVGAGATMCFLSTPVVEALFDGPLQGLDRLRFLLTGGDRLSRRPPLTLPCPLVNQYGPTENTVWSTAETVSPTGPGVPSIGRPIGNVRCYVLDENSRLLPPGAPGELYLAGANVAEGYLGRPELTRERFPVDPYVTGHDHMYATGDSVRWTASGTLQFLGRSDGQVKIRGVRVEVGEVEAALRVIPGIREATVVATAGVGGRAELRAFLVADHRSPIPPNAELNEQLRRHLPSSFLPVEYRQLDRLPLTPNGKLDRAALLQVSAAARAERATASSVGDPAVEQLPASVLVLRAVLADVLGIDQVPSDAGFLEMGGDSLLAMRVLARASAAGVHLGLRDLMEAVDIIDLARRMRSLPVSDGDAEARWAPPTVLRSARDDGEQRLIRCDGTPSMSVAELDERFRAAMAESGAVGGSLTVRHLGGLSEHAVGEASVQSGVPVDKRTLFRVESQTKIATMTAVLRLCEAGLVDLDDKVLDHLAEPARYESLDGVTVRHLLSHQSGLIDFPADAYTAVGRSVRETAIRSSECPRLFVPGNSNSYSSAAFVVLGALVEDVTAEPWSEHVSQHVLAALGLRHSCATVESAMAHRLAPGHLRNLTTGVQEVADGPIPRGLAPTEGLFATTRDLLDLVSLYTAPAARRGSGLLSAESIMEAVAGERVLGSGFAPDLHQGLTWQIGRWAGRRLLLHQAFGGGSSGGVVIDHDNGLGYVTAINSDAGEDVSIQMSQLLMEELLGVRVPEHGASGASGSVDFAKYEGRYVHDARRSYEVTGDGRGGLVLRTPDVYRVESADSHLPLRPLDDRRFTFSGGFAVFGDSDDVGRPQSLHVRNRLARRQPSERRTPADKMGRR